MFRSLRSLWGRKVALAPRPPSATLKRGRKKKRTHVFGVACHDAPHFNHHFNSDGLTISQLENKFGGYQKSLYLCTVKPIKT